MTPTTITRKVLSPIAVHLQDMHGLDLVGEYEWAPPATKLLGFGPDTLTFRHEALHDEGLWNEAADRHEHVRP